MLPGTEQALQPAATVVIVEDEADIASLLVDVLVSLGYQALTVSGHQAARRIGEIHPDAVVLDYAMPGITARDVLDQLARVDGDRPPVLLVTGRPDAADLGRQVGAEAALRKPFDLDEFVAVIRVLTARPASNGEAAE